MRRRLIALLCATLLIACDADNKYSTRYACNFVFNTQYHTASLLTATLTDSGTFAIVKIELKNGIPHLLISTNHSQQTEDLALTAELEKRQVASQSVGANRSLIIGCSVFNELKAYDRQCPNCLDEFGGVNYPLEFDGNDAVVCNKCKRLYLLNSEGMCVSGEKDDQKLLQYRVDYREQRLAVHN